MSVVMSSHEQRMAAAPTFAVREAHALVRDLATPDLRRYWADMLLSAAGGWAGVLLLSTAGPGRWWVLATYPVVMLLMYLAEWPFAWGAASTNPLVDYHIVYALALIVIAVLHAGDTWGLGAMWKMLPLVQRFRWLV